MCLRIGEWSITYLNAKNQGGGGEKNFFVLKNHLGTVSKCPNARYQ